MVVEAERQFVNHQDRDFSCPHCCTGYVDGFVTKEWKKVICKLCDEPFAIREVHIIQHESGFIIEENDNE